MTRATSECAFKNYTLDKTRDAILSDQYNHQGFPDNQTKHDETEYRTPLDQGLEGLAHQISHQLRTPLNSVIGFSDMMREELYGPVGSYRYREYLDHISESAKHMLRAAEETLSLTSQLNIPHLVSSSRSYNLSAIARRAALCATKDLGYEMRSIDLQISHSIEIWGCNETTIKALTYLFRSQLLQAPLKAGIKAFTVRKNLDTVVLTIERKPDEYSSPRSNQAKHIPTDSVIFKALALSLFKQQGLCVNSLALDTDEESVFIELELSAQQAFTL
ncbi:MAG TPA: hypothetical protein TECP_01311 [Hyphomicrobiaceae bacterium MAG_BT-2024]